MSNAAGAEEAALAKDWERTDFRLAFGLKAAALGLAPYKFTRQKVISTSGSACGHQGAHFSQRSPFQSCPAIRAGWLGRILAL
jgi:hypothetical protein